MEGTYMPIKFILHSLCMCLTLCDPMNGSLPGSFDCGILQARILHGLPCPSPAHLPDPGIEPRSPQSPALAGEFFTTMPPGKPKEYRYFHKYL